MPGIEFGELGAGDLRLNAPRDCRCRHIIFGAYGDESRRSDLRDRPWTLARAMSVKASRRTVAFHVGMRSSNGR